MCPTFYREASNIREASTKSGRSVNDQVTFGLGAESNIELGKDMHHRGKTLQIGIRKYIEGNTGSV